MTASNVHHADFLSSYHQLPLVKWSLDCYEIQIILWLLPGLTLLPPSISCFHFTDGPKLHGEGQQKVTEVKTATQSYFHSHAPSPPVPSEGHFISSSSLSRLTFPRLLWKSDSFALVENQNQIYSSSNVKSILISLTVTTLVAFMKVFFLIQFQNSSEASEELNKNPDSQNLGFLPHRLCSHAFKLTCVLSAAQCAESKLCVTATK